MAGAPSLATARQLSFVEKINIHDDSSRFHLVRAFFLLRIRVQDTFSL